MGRGLAKRFPLSKVHLTFEIFARLMNELHVCISPPGFCGKERKY